MKNHHSLRRTPEFYYQCIVFLKTSFSSLYVAKAVKKRMICSCPVLALCSALYLFWPCSYSVIVLLLFCYSSYSVFGLLCSVLEHGCLYTFAKGFSAHIHSYISQRCVNFVHCVSCSPLLLFAFTML